MINFVKDKMTLRVPTTKARSCGMRPLASSKQVDEALVAYSRLTSLALRLLEPGGAKLPRPPISGKATGDRPKSVILERSG